MHKSGKTKEEAILGANTMLLVCANYQPCNRRVSTMCQDCARTKHEQKGTGNLHIQPKMLYKPLGVSDVCFSTSACCLRLAGILL